MQNITSALCAGVLLSTFALLSVACSSSLHPSNEQVAKQTTKTTQAINNALQIEILQIAPHKKSCFGAFPMQCLVVNGDYFYDHIEGFEFEDGYRYILKVSKIQYCNPEILNDCPQDIGIYKYSLLEVIKKEKAPD